MFEIAVIGDVHDHQERLSRVLDRLAGCSPDLALLVGDLGLDPPWSESGRRTERQTHDASVRRVIASVRGSLGCPIAFVPGNHDLKDAAEDTDGVNCDGRVVDLAGLRIAGLGGAGPTRFGFPYEWKEPEAEETLRQMSAGEDPVDLFVCHTPPSDTTLDRTYQGSHVGSRAVRGWIATARPRLVVCGHIHEALGVERVEGVLCLNAGALGDPFGEKIAWTVRWGADGPAGIRSYRSASDGTAETRNWL